jgi:ribosomal-protein-alanine N-acetyltransferase
MYLQYATGSLLVESLAHGQPLELCGLLKRMELPQPDPSFAFLPQYPKQGFALEFAKLVLADIYERKLTEKVLAFTSINNEKSIDLLKKLGFPFKGLIRLAANSED